MQTIHATETNTRFDMYLFVHKGLRAFMSSVLTTVGRIDAQDAAEVASGIEQVRQLLDICRAHLFAENQFLHTAMEARRRGSAYAMTNEHVQQEDLLEQLESKLFEIERSSGKELETKLLNLYRALALFVAENFQHMHAEETDNNGTLWSLYTDDELQAIHSELLKSIEPQKMIVFLRWVLPSVSRGERESILAGLQKEMPRPVFEHLLTRIRPVLTSPLA
jgi:hemerythrin-like domain-containing protein